MFFSGELNSPSRSIRYAVTISKNNDKILVDADKQNPYKECSNTSDSSIELIGNKSLSFLGINGTAVIECHPGCNLFEVRFSFNKTRVILSDLVMSRVNTVVQCFKVNVELVFNRCIFEIYNTGVHIKGSMRCSIQTIDCSFRESTISIGNFSEMYQSNSSFYEYLILRESC